MTSRLHIVWWMLFLCLAGCGQSGPVKHRVSGSVSWMGVPIEQGYIKFLPTSGTGTEEALPIQNGSFAGDITPGDKKVEILATREKQEPTPEDLKAKETMGMLPRESFIPEEYNVKTILTVTVGPGDNKFDFALPQQR